MCKKKKPRKKTTKQALNKGGIAVKTFITLGGAKGITCYNKYEDPNYQ